MEDKLLVWKLKRGSRDALRLIYDKHHGHLLKLAVLLTGRADVAEDVVQEVFVNFTRLSDRISLTGSLKSYLTTSTLNCIRNRRRYNKHRKLRSLDQVEHIPSTEKRPDQWAVLNEYLERLSEAMASLPYEQREVITLRTGANMSLRQIARVQKASVTTVNARYRYGIEKLRSLLNGGITE